MTKYSFLAAALLFATTVMGDCAGGKKGGMCYETQTRAVKFTGVGHDGEYNAVTQMNSRGACNEGSVQTRPKKFGGPLAPFNEDLSVHIRGPLKLLNFAWYMPGDSPDYQAKVKRDMSVKRHHHKRHQHAHLHKRAVDYVTTTQYCTSTVWVDGVATPTVYANNLAVGGGAADAPGGAGAPDTHAPGGNEQPAAPQGGLKRTSYYSAKPDVPDDNVLFMNNKGGDSTSGTWSSCFGNSLSYCSADGLHPATSPTCLQKGILIPSNNEYSIWQSAKCGGGDSCGYSYGPLAYRGWGGCQKTMVIEFSAPSDGKTGFNMDMPAVWMLNAQIPRTLMYPAHKQWSCWPKCGELDCFETLSAEAKEYMVATIHNAQGSKPDGSGGIMGGGMGCTNWFKRPMKDGETFIGVVSLNCDGTVAISQIDSFDWPESLDQSTIDSYNKNPVVKPLAN